MKKIITSLAVTLLCVTFSMNLLAQGEQVQSSATPVKMSNSILYGNDVIINNSPSQNQRDVCLSVAFNGWLYACYSVNEGGNWSWVIWRSVDDGETWSLFREQPLNTDWNVHSIDIVVTGLAEGDLLVFVSRILNNNVSGLSELLVSRLDGNTGATLATLTDQIISSPDQFRDVAIVSDYRFPATGATPFSVAVLYSRYSSISDSLRILTSSNGGNSFDGAQYVDITGAYLRNVSLAYGRSWNFSNGRYFAAWERRGSQADDLCMIYTAHSTTFFNDAFTTPLRLDDMIGGTSNFARNPSISCQFNDVDNDLLNLTEVVLFDRAFEGNISNFDIVGCFNKEAVTTDNWNIFGMDATYLTSDIQPDINFDPAWNNFLATYCNLTDQKLRFLVKGMNMADPYNWWLINDKYNDNNNLLNPYPKVEINPVYVQVAHVWNAESTGGGQATFDAEYSVIGIDNLSSPAVLISVSPNPSVSKTTFTVEVKEPGALTVKLYSLQGTELMLIGSGFYTPGVYPFTTDVTALPKGCYIYRAILGDKTGTGRLIVR